MLLGWEVIQNVEKSAKLEGGNSWGWKSQASHPFSLYALKHSNIIIILWTGGGGGDGLGGGGGLGKQSEHFISLSHSLLIGR